LNIPRKNGVRKSTKNQIETWKFEKRKKKQIAKEEKKYFVGIVICKIFLRKTRTQTE
jgi:hypothetical protein